MSSSLGVSIFALIPIIRTAPHRYKTFTIPKKDGTPRIVAQPTKLVKDIQRWLVANELSALPLHKAAMAYRPGIGIRSNAEAHSGGAFLLKMVKMDFANFFPSIGAQDVVRHLQTYGKDRWSPDEISVICRCVLWLPKRSTRLQLCVGGPSSPFISNSIMFAFDTQIDEFCRRKGAIYTRYADDLVFSTKEPEVLRLVEAHVTKTVDGLDFPRLEINQKKTIRTSKGHLRRVTGLTITPLGDVSLGRERKREIRAKLHHFIHKSLSSEEVAQLRGLLAFSMDVEPSFVDRLALKYGTDVMKAVMSADTRNLRSGSTSDKR
jgi:hypothetical protein